MSQTPKQKQQQLQREQHPNWGGARQGAGRPLGSESKTKVVIRGGSFYQKLIGILQENAEKACKVLGELLKSKNELIKLRAADLILRKILPDQAPIPSDEMGDQPAEPVNLPPEAVEAGIKFLTLTRATPVLEITVGKAEEKKDDGK